MTDIDRLTQFIYLIANYLFYDATVYKNRVNIYNSAGGCLATIYINSFDPDGIIVYDGCVNEKGVTFVPSFLTMYEEELRGDILAVTVMAVADVQITE